MRGDPKLCFLSKCGPPDNNEEEKKGSFEQDDSKLDDDEDRCNFRKKILNLFNSETWTLSQNTLFSP